MKNKIFILMAMIVMLSVNLISADLEISTSKLEFTSENKGLQEFNITNKGNEGVTVEFKTPVIDSINFHMSGDTTILGNSTHTFTINPSSINFDDFDFMEGHSGILEVKETGTSNKKEIKIIVLNDGLEGIKDDLKVEIKDIKVKDGFGKDDEWFPLDNVEVELKVKNSNRDFDIDDIDLEWGVYDLKNLEWYIDGEESGFDLKNRKDVEFNINFKLDYNIDDLDGGDFVFYAWVTGELDDEEDSELILSNVHSQDVSVEIERDFVILDNVQIPESSACGGELHISAEVWNIGDDDQENAYVKIYNDELGINEKVKFSEIDAFEYEALDLRVKIPSDAEEKEYTINFKVYEEDNKQYKTGKKSSEFNHKVNVVGNCKGKGINANIVASISEGGEAGEELVITAVVTNKDSVSGTFVVSVEGYNDWAKSVNIDKSNIVLNEGGSEILKITFDIKNDVEGLKNFNIKLIDANGFAMEQPVQVEIKNSGFFNFDMGNNLSIILLGVLSLVLLIAIAVVIAKIAFVKK